MNRYDPAFAQAKEGARDAIARWPADDVLADNACDRLMRSWGLSRDAALELVGSERRLRRLG